MEKGNKDLEHNGEVESLRHILILPLTRKFNPKVNNEICSKFFILPCSGHLGVITRYRIFERVGISFPLSPRDIPSVAWYLRWRGKSLFSLNRVNFPFNFHDFRSLIAIPP